MTNNEQGATTGRELSTRGQSIAPGIKAADIALVKDVPADVKRLYKDAGYQPDDVTFLEGVASSINNLKRAGTIAIIQIGEMLDTVLSGIPHGDKGFFIEERLGMSWQTVNRYQAAYRVVTANPLLAENIDNVSPTALYKLGQSKKANADIVGLVAAMAEDGEVSDEDVADTITKFYEGDGSVVAQPKEQKLGFAPFAADRATKALANIVGLTDQMYGSIAKSGLHPQVLAKNKLFKEFAQRVAKGSGEGELETSLTGLLYAAFVIAYSAEHGDKQPTITIEQ